MYRSDPDPRPRTLGNLHLAAFYSDNPEDIVSIAGITDGESYGLTLISKEEVVTVRDYLNEVLEALEREPCCVCGK